MYPLIANYREHHHHILPSAVSDYKVEEGGVGMGTRISFRVTVAGQTTLYLMTVSEPEPGRVLIESGEQVKTTFVVEPHGSGCRVRIESEFELPGVMGAIQALFGPPVIRRLYRQELELLDGYARGQAAAG